MKKLFLISLVLIALISVNSYGNLIAYWSFDDGTATDNSGNGYNGTMVNNPIPVPGVHGIGQAMSFIGAGYYIHVGYSASSIGSHIDLPNIDLSIYSSYTLALWVFDSTLSNNAGENYISFGNNSAGWIGLQRGRDLDNPSSYGTFYLFTSAGNILLNGLTRYPFDMQNLGKWTHYSLVYNSGTLKTYINGILTFTQTGMSNQTITGNSGMASHYWVYDGEYRKSARFTGALDEVMIFNEALSDSAVKSLVYPAPKLAINSSNCYNKTFLLKAVADSVASVTLIASNNAAISYTPNTPSKTITISANLLDNSKDGHFTIKVVSTSGSSVQYSDSIIAPGRITSVSPITLGAFVMDSTQVNYSTSKNVTANNASANNAKIITAYLINGTDFSIPSGQFPISVNKLSSANITVTFTPKSIGLKTDTLVLITACDTFKVAVSGVGYKLALAPTIASLITDCFSKTFNAMADSIASISIISSENTVMSFTPSAPATSISISLNLTDKTKDGHFTIRITGTNGKSIDYSDSILYQGRITSVSPLVLKEFVMDSTVINTTSSKTITAYNATNHNGAIINAYLTNGTEFSIPVGQFAIALNKLSLANISLNFSPKNIGLRTDTLVLITACDTFKVPVSAVGIKLSLAPTISSTSTNCYLKTFSAQADSVADVKLLSQDNSVLSFTPSVPATAVAINIHLVDKSKDGHFTIRVTSTNSKTTDYIDSIITPGKISSVSPLVASVCVMDSTLLNNTSSKTIIASNKTSKDATIIDAYFTSGAVFSIPSGQFPMPLGKNSFSNIILNFAPKQLGLFTDTLVLITACDTYKVAVNGVGYKVSLHPEISSLSSDCYSKTFKVNADSVALVYLVSGDNAEMSYSPKTPATTIYVTVKLKDNSKDGRFDINITSTNGKSIDYADSIKIVGKITSVSPLLLNEFVMDSTTINSTTSKAIAASNATDRDATIISAYLAKGSDFSIPAGQFALTLNHSSFANISLNFTPTQVGLRTDTLFLITACDTFKVAISGIGKEAVGLAPEISEEASDCAKKIYKAISKDFDIKSVDIISKDNVNITVSPNPPSMTVSVSVELIDQSKDGSYSIAVTTKANMTSNIIGSISAKANLSEYNPGGASFVRLDSTGLGLTSFGEVAVSNTSSSDITIDKAYFIYNTEYSVVPSELPKIIPANSVGKIKVAFNPIELRERIDTLYIVQACGKLKIPFNTICKANEYDVSGECGTSLDVNSLSIIPQYLSLTPNPAVNAIKVKIKVAKGTSQSNLNIVNSLGDKYETKVISASTSSENGSDIIEYQIDISKLSCGVYQLVYNGATRISHSFVVDK